MMDTTVNARPIQEFKTQAPTTSLMFFPDSERVVHFSNDSKLATILRMPDGTQVGSWSAFACVVSVSRDGKHVVCGGRDGRLRIWAVDKMESVDGHVPRETREGHRDEVTALDTSFSLIASGAWDSSICLWSPRGDKLAGPLYCDNDKVASLQFSPRGDLLLVCVRDTITIWKIDNNRLVQTEVLNVKLSRATASRVVWSHDGRYVFTGSDESDSVTVIDVTTGSTRQESMTCPHSVLPDGGFIVSSSQQDGVQFLDTATYSCIKRLPDHSPLGTSPDGRLLVTVPKDSRRGLAVWSLRDILQSDSTLGSNLNNPPLLVSSWDDRPPPRFSLTGTVKSAVGGSWDDWLCDAERAIKSESTSLQDYDNYVALRAARPRDEAFDTFLSSLQCSQQKALKSAADAILDEVFKHGPRVLIDTRTGHLCDESQRKLTFKADPVFKELLSSATGNEGKERIRLAAEAFCRYVMFSHTWHSDDEPSFQHVSEKKSVYSLQDIFVDNKLRKFCQMVRALGYLWAWSDTCCIDKPKEAVLREAVTSMYRWYKESALTLAYLADVTPDAGNLLHSRWMKRAWTLQELVAPNVIRFYDSTWQPYRNDPRLNHKDSPDIAGELLTAISEIATVSETTFSFDIGRLSPREKLRLASTRKATKVEDAAYALIGIFGSTIVPNYGEGGYALGRLLQEIVEHRGDVTILDWTGRPSEFNSSLPADIAVYQESPGASASTPDLAWMEVRVEALRGVSAAAEDIYRGVVSLPRTHFNARCLRLPCIIFPVIKLRQLQGSPQNHMYLAKVSAIGNVVIATEASHPLDETKLILVYPWIDDLLRSLDGAREQDVYTLENRFIDPDSDQDNVSSDEDEFYASISSTFLQPSPPDNSGKALQLIVRLEQQFTALLLQQESHRRYKRVATDHKIIVHIQVSSQLKDIYTKVLEIS